VLLEREGSKELMTTSKIEPHPKASVMPNIDLNIGWYGGFVVFFSVLFFMFMFCFALLCFSFILEIRKIGFDVLSCCYVLILSHFG
jgi:hypothetical protein